MVSKIVTKLSDIFIKINKYSISHSKNYVYRQFFLKYHGISFLFNKCAGKYFMSIILAWNNVAHYHSKRLYVYKIRSLLPLYCCFIFFVIHIGLYFSNFKSVKIDIFKKEWHYNLFKKRINFEKNTKMVIFVCQNTIEKKIFC